MGGGVSLVVGCYVTVDLFSLFVASCFGFAQTQNVGHGHCHAAVFRLLKLFVTNRKMFSNGTFSISLIKTFVEKLYCLHVYVWCRSDCRFTV